MKPALVLLLLFSTAHADTFVGPEVRHISTHTYLINGITFENAPGRICTITLGLDGQLNIDQCHIDVYKGK